MKWLTNLLLRGATKRCRKKLRGEMDSSAELDLIAIAFACACYPTGTYKSDAYNRIPCRHQIGRIQRDTISRC
ncbi:hypothetical protein LF1_54930 [Rubripirellula obstinata]|uniref:Uncharacterized protein n=1 Tax=Rubripirellula obstinata TaxID=406547 RepID=A0A5B1CDB5_9BACT|nr:hypothetical protein LF1_54930 [Rubripirellula obstinata]